MDWKRLGVLLGAYDPMIGKLIADWPNITEAMRAAISMIVIASTLPEPP